MIKIYLETGKKTTSEYVFIETLIAGLTLSEKHKRFFDNKDYWDLECEALEPLKKFLKDC